MLEPAVRLAAGPFSRSAVPTLIIGALVGGFVACGDDDGTGPDPGPNVASVTVTAGSATTLESLDETVQLQATALDADGDPVSGVTFTWTSSAPEVASVDGTGLATAVANGQAEIGAETGGTGDELTITVEQAASELTYSSPPTNNSVDVPFAQLEVELRDANGNVATNFADAVTISTGENPLGGSLTGQFTRDAVNGVVAFPGLALDEAGAGYTLVAEAGALSVESVAFNVTRQSMYVGHGVGTELTLIDLTADTVMATVPLGGAPRAVALSPDGLFAYVANFSADSVAVLETPGNTVVETMPVGDLTQFIRMSPDGNVAYATNSNSDNMSVISTASNTVIETVDVGTFPLGIAFTPDGAFAYVVAGPGDSVSVVSTATHTVVDRIGVGNGPIDAAVTPDGSTVYVTSNNADNLTIISTATNTVVGTVPVGGGPVSIAITPDGSAAFVTNEDDDTVSRIDTNTNTSTATIAVQDRPIAVAVTPDGGFVYVTNALEPSVSVIEVASNTVTETITVATSPVDLAIMPAPAP